MSLMISDPSRSPAAPQQLVPPQLVPQQLVPPQFASGEPRGADPGGGSLESWAESWTESWTETWTEDDPEPVAVPRPIAPTVPLVGGAPVPPTHRVAPFAPIRAGTGRHRLSASARRRPGPIAVALLVAVTTLVLGTTLHSQQQPFHGHAAASSAAQVHG